MSNGYTPVKDPDNGPYVVLFNYSSAGGEISLNTGQFGSTVFVAAEIGNVIIRVYKAGTSNPIDVKLHPGQANQFHEATTVDNITIEVNGSGPFSGKVFIY